MVIQRDFISTNEMCIHYKYFFFGIPAHREPTINHITRFASASADEKKKQKRDD